MEPRTFLIATADDARRTFLAFQLDADGHTVHDADHLAAVVAKLSVHAIDVMVLGDLEHPADGPALLRAIRAGEQPRIHPGQPVITIGADDELTALRAYECGSDHHLTDTTGYVLLRAILATVARRTLEDPSARHLHAGDIHIDLAARTVTVAGTVVGLSPVEFKLLVKFAGDPVRVFSKHELSRCIWRQQRICERTVDSHIARLRTRLTQAGAYDVLVNKWGQGWSLTTPQ
ncbi:MAG: two-component system, OmpR family, phosphate regulon response regulator PhoB [Solirubrobacteraceae bacterium]|jgi:DNA-binding response OmpR family regulator|nr:two-component system, OmpR family, phosphate regulon response regulator PhoB [Solirubrobacteraceae bacterium]